MQIVERIAAGINTPQKILEGLNIHKLKAGKEDLEKSLKGVFKPWYVKVLKQHLTAYYFYKKQMLAYELWNRINIKNFIAFSCTANYY